MGHFCLNIYENNENNDKHFSKLLENCTFKLEDLNVDDEIINLRISITDKKN